MSRILQIGKLGLYFAGTTLLAVLSWAVVHEVRNLDTLSSQTATSVNQLVQQMDGAVDGINGTTKRLNQTLDAVNRPCGSGHPCGLLADTAKTLNTARLTLGQIEIAANHEDKNLTTLDRQEATLFGDTHQLLASGNTLLTTTNTSLQSEFGSLNKTTSDLDAFLTDPNLSTTVRNLSTVSGNVAATTGDFQNKFHAILYPPVCKGWKCHLKTTWQGVKLGLDLLEPVYYGQQLLH